MSHIRIPFTASQLPHHMRETLMHAERRLLFRKMADPESTPEEKKGAESGTEKKEKEKQEKPKQEKEVKKETDKTKEAVKNVIPQVDEVPTQPATAEPKEPSIGELWKPLPRPDTNALKIAGITGAAIIAPLPTAVAGAGYLGWKQLTKIPPFRWVDSGVKKGFSALSHVAGRTAHALTYPLRLSGAVGANILRVGGRGLYNVLDFTLLEPYREITERLAPSSKEEDKEAELGQGKDKGLHPLSIAYLLGHKFLWEAPKTAIKWYGKMWYKHPIFMFIAHMAGPEIISNISVPGIMKGIGEFWDLVKGLGWKFIGTAPVAP